MAKMYGIGGFVSGKIGSNVMVIRNGVQIVRQYNPIPAKSSTTAQVAARAKFKELTQLAEIMSPVLAIPKRGIVSARNLFVKKNYPAVSFSNETASVDLLSIKITDSILSLPSVVATSGDSSTSVSLAGSADQGIDTVVYVQFVRENDGSLRHVLSTVVTVPGANRRFEGSVALTATAGIVYAYGIRTLTETARVNFGNVAVLTAEYIATLLANRVITNEDVIFTETRAALVTPAS